MLRTTLPLPYPRKMFVTGHVIFPEKIVLLKQLSGSANKLDNDYIESFGPMMEINSVTKPEIPRFDEKE